MKDLKKLFYEGLYEEILEKTGLQDDQNFLEREIFRSLAISHIGSLNLAREIVENALIQAKTKNLPRITFLAIIVLAWMHERLENFNVAKKLMSKAKILADSMESDQTTEFVKEWISWIYIVQSLSTIYTSSDKDKGRNLISKAVIAAKRSGSKFQLAFAKFYQSWFFLQLDELEIALKAINESLELFQAINCTPWEGYARLVIANIYNDKNEIELSINSSKMCIETLETINVTCCHATSLFWLSRYYQINDQIPIAIKYFQGKLKEYTDSKFSWGVSATLERLGEIYLHQGKFQEALDFYSKILNLELEYNHELDNIQILGKIGDIHNGMNNFEVAIDYYEKCVIIANKYNQRDFIAESQRLYGIAYLSKSDLTNAYNCLTEAYDNFKHVGDITNVATTLISLGDIAKIRGKYPLALEKYKHSIEIYSRIGININALKATNFPFTLHKIGAIYHLMEDYEKSSEYYSLGLDYFVKIKDNSGIIYTNYLLLTLKLKMGKVSEADAFKKVIDDLSAIHSTPKNLLLQKMSEALILKNGSRLTSKLKAQELFKEISVSPIIMLDITVSAMLNLCDLLINEVKSYGENDALEELIEVTRKLREISIKEEIPYLLVETLLVECKLAVINSNLGEVQTLFLKAKELSIKQGIKYLIVKVEQEENKFHQELNTWQNLTNQDFSLSEKVKQLQITEYISMLQNSHPELLHNIESTN